MINPGSVFPCFFDEVPACCKPAAHEPWHTSAANGSRRMRDMSARIFSANGYQRSENGVPSRPFPGVAGKIDLSEGAVISCTICYR